jgi:uncharacterized protein (DUF58 family)
VQLYPTRKTFDVAIAATGLITLGTAARLAPVVAFGGAMLIAIAVGRAITLLGVTRLRAEGFEMIWTGPARVHRAARGAPLVLGCEIVNRSLQNVRMDGIHAIASSMLDTSVRPAHVDLGPGTRARLEVNVRGERIGRWGVHGLAMQVSTTPLRTSSPYEVPLRFASPLGVEVLPRALTAFALSPRGARATRASWMERRGRGQGHSHEIRELRDHAPGDPLKRVAWKASARRGRLLVREMERDEGDIVWLVVDVSVDLWAGRPGTAPLDRVGDEVASLAVYLLRRGERVGLVTVASRTLSRLAPQCGMAHGSHIADALVDASSAMDIDRSSLAETDVARLVAEHARPLQSSSAAPLPRGDLDELAERTKKLRRQAPFEGQEPFAPTPRERSLRSYLASFGIESPPRESGERERAESMVAQTLEHLARQKPRPSVVHVWAPAPSRPLVLAKALGALQKKHVAVRWNLPPYDWTPGPADDPGGVSAAVAAEVARMRASAARLKGERALRRLGVRIGAPR